MFSLNWYHLENFVNFSIFDCYVHEVGMIRLFDIYIWVCVVMKGNGFNEGLSDEMRLYSCVKEIGN